MQDEGHVQQGRGRTPRSAHTSGIEGMPLATERCTLCPCTLELSPLSSKRSHSLCSRDSLLIPAGESSLRPTSAKLQIFFLHDTNYLNKKVLDRFGRNARGVRIPTDARGDSDRTAHRHTAVQMVAGEAALSLDEGGAEEGRGGGAGPFVCWGQARARGKGVSSHMRGRWEAGQDARGRQPQTPRRG